jgi:hypothetical protein
LRHLHQASVLFSIQLFMIRLFRLRCCVLACSTHLSSFHGTTLAFADSGIDEAGFEQLIGTEESRVSSDQYSEKARVMSKGFVLHALTSNIASLDNILTWLYLVRHGPNLLKRVLASSNALLGIGPAPGKAGQAAEGSEGLEGSGSARANVAPEARVSAGAMILLRRHVVLLQTVSDETSRALYGVQPEHAAGSGSSGL